MTLSVVSGGIATLSIYGVLVIWRETGSLGLAVAAVLPELTVLALLGLLAKQRLTPRAANVPNLDQAITDLMATTPLQRLIAVRQLTQWVQQQRLTAQQQQDVAHCFQLLLQHESEPLVGNAVRAGLTALKLPTRPQVSTPTPYRPRSRRSVTVRQKPSVLQPVPVPSLPQT